MAAQVRPDGVSRAGQRIAGLVHRTPVLTSRRLDLLAGAQVFCKCENLQRAGSFKVRGAFNALLQLDRSQAAAGVLAYSSGNHAQAVALAARDLGMGATILMPHDAPQVKVAATGGYGAQVVRYDRYAQRREDVGAQVARERGLTLIPPYDHPHILTGQGTAAAELLAEAEDLDVLIAPLGGGGLLSGSILAAQEAGSRARIYGVEPHAGDDGLQSLRAGRIVSIDTPRTIADGAQTQHLGEHTFPIIRSGVTDILTVTDERLGDAMTMVASVMKLVVEPTGVLALAALLAHPELVDGARVGVILSGGNVDLNRYAELITAE